MKVSVLGTGSMYTKYHSACALINEELLIDIPNGTIKQLLRKGYQPERIKYLLITHFHGDHIADIPFLPKYDFVTQNKKQKLVLIGPKGLEEKVGELFKAYHFEEEEQRKRIIDIEYREIEDEQELIIDNYRIKVQKVLHEEEPAYGYCINATLGYTGDSGLCSGVEKICDNSNIMIADTSMIEGDGSHMGIKEIEQLIGKYDKPIIPTHLRDRTREELKKHPRDKIMVVEDGYRFEC